MEKSRPFVWLLLSVLVVNAFSSGADAQEAAAQEAVAQDADAQRLTAQEPVAFASERLMVHVRYLAGEPLQGRRAGSEFEERAAAYVTTQLDQAGVPPLPGGTRVQRFPIVPGPDAPQSLNVLGWIEPGPLHGEEGVIVVGAHIDHLGQLPDGTYFPGADDNASGVAVLLEIAAALHGRRHQLRRPVCVVFFGAEEIGLVGSRRFVQRGPIKQSRVVAMVNIDMIGRPLLDQAQLSWTKKLLRVDSTNSIGVVGTQGRPFFRDTVLQACEQARMTAYGHQAVLSPVVANLARNRADHSAFEAIGIPTLFFGSGESDDYHKPTDTIDKIDGKLMARRAVVVYEVVLALAAAPRERLREKKKPVPEKSSGERSEPSVDDSES